MLERRVDAEQQAHGVVWGSPGQRDRRRCVACQVRFTPRPANRVNERGEAGLNPRIDAERQIRQPFIRGFPRHQGDAAEFAGPSFAGVDDQQADVNGVIAGERQAVGFLGRRRSQVARGLFDGNEGALAILAPMAA